jgi:hypothetical protein
MRARTMNSRLIVDSATTAVIQFILLAGLPFLGYFIYQRRRYNRSFSDTLKKAGLQRCPGRYLAYSIAFAVAGVIIGSDLATAAGAADASRVNVSRVCGTRPHHAS